MFSLRLPGLRMRSSMPPIRIMNPRAMTLLEAVEGTGKPFLHTSGSSVVGTQAGGRLVEGIYDEQTPFTPSPGRAARAALNKRLLANAGPGTRAVIVCPSLIYGLGSGPSQHSMQIPWLLDSALRHGVAKHFGPGTNRWANVHIDDLVDLFRAGPERRAAGCILFRRERRGVDARIVRGNRFDAGP